MTLNSASETKLKDVKPDLVKVVRRAAEITTQPFQIVQGNRTQAYQNELYAQGRTKPGKIVTWTKNSKHIGGGAVDFAALVGGTINWDTKYYPAIAAAFKKAASEAGVGIAWGGDWKTKDWGHIELIASSAPEPVTPEKPSTPVASVRTTLKQGMTGGDVPVLQMRLRDLGYTITVDGDYGPKTAETVKKFQTSAGLKADSVVGPLTWAALYKENAPVVPAPIKDAPVLAIAYFESVGWSHLAAVALTANLMWESGGNTKKPPTIVFDAHGDKDANGVYRSHGAGQWNEKAGRYDALLKYALEKNKPWDDPDTQLAFLDYELRTTERGAGVVLRAADTIEKAVDACIKIWRPSEPHTEQRLAIARKLL